ncbi:single-stranded-DNA-specific exonuclease RecJ [Vibrio harveyi]|uniref:single-stranded-DNA-specific exonuclease RecJ n=1 Tax=Vibrio harveyi TaxID=669 RepID=UPI003CEF1063
MSNNKIRPISERIAANSNEIVQDPIVNRIYQNRGVKDASELDLSLKNLLNPFLIKDMDKAVQTLIRHFHKQSHIVIVGDYDCDGATSTSIAEEGLKLLGFENVSFIIPDRMVHGYGLTPTIVDLAAESKPDLILTVDNGISSFEGAKRVYEIGAELLITDHHLQSPDGLPMCEAAVNINRDDCEFPSKNLAGCGVMFYTIAALRNQMEKEGIFDSKGISKPDIMPLIDLVSLGTVADVVPLDYNNRILVNAGIQRTRAGHARPAINEILKQKNKDPYKVTSTDWGFAVGPVLNAAGRLENMTKGIETLLERNSFLVTNSVSDLVDLNERRKEIAAEMEEEANKYLISTDEGWGITLFDQSWHEGVIGILASRVKEQSNRPVICMTETDECKEARELWEELQSNGSPADVIENAKNQFLNSDVKGSARSIPGVHLKHILDSINKAHPEVLSKFGGHAMAAGLSLPVKHFEKFKALFDEYCQNAITPEMISGELMVDVKDINSSYLTLENAEMLRDLSPWGQHFEQPVFSAKFIVTDFIKRGNNKQHLFLMLQPLDSSEIVEAICFNCLKPGEEDPFRVNGIVECAFKMDVNEFRGHKKLQLMLEHFQDKELILSKQKEQTASVTIGGAKTAQKALMRNTTSDIAL